MEKIYLRRKLLLIVCFLFVATATRADEDEDMRPVGAMSAPEAGALLKNVSYQVNHSQGVVNVSVPVTEIGSGEITVPVSLSYVTSGIRLEDRESVSGLGWKLTAGGKITRMVRGEPDDCDEPGYWIKDGNTLWNQFYTKNKTQYYVKEPDYEHDYKHFHNFYDTQPDIFFFETPNASGVFVIDADGKAHTIPYSNTKIEWVNKDYFKITDENGTEYLFGISANGKEHTHIRYKHYNLERAMKYDITYVSAWHLEQLESIMGDRITLEYETGDNIDNSYENFFATFKVRDNGTNEYVSKNHKNIKNVIKAPKYIKKISCDNGRVEFVYNATDRHFLKQVKVYDRNSSFLNSYSFTINKWDNGRWYLKEVWEEGKRRMTRKLFDFEYYTGHMMPNAGRHKDFDHWGFYNGANNTEYKGPFNGIGADRSPRLNFTKSHVLTAIVYPTGSRIEYDYELNKDKEGNDVGGLRIKEVRTYADDAQPVVTRYSYEEGENYSTPIYHEFQRGTAVRHSITSKPMYAVSDIMGNHIFYGKVTEIYPNNSSSVYYFTTTKEFPDTEFFYRYSNKSGNPSHREEVQDFQTSYFWARGLTKKEESYDNNGRLVYEKNYAYNIYSLTGDTNLENPVKEFITYRVKLESNDNGEKTRKYLDKFTWNIYKLNLISIAENNPVALSKKNDLNYNALYNTLYSEVTICGGIKTQVTYGYPFAPLDIKTPYEEAQKYLFEKRLFWPVAQTEKLDDKNIRASKYNYILSTVNGRTSPVIESVEQIIYDGNGNPVSESTDIEYIKYTNKGRPVLKYNNTGESTSFVYNNNESEIIAEVTNAYPDANSPSFIYKQRIFHTSFEEESGKYKTDKAKTGEYVHNGPYTKSLSSLDPQINYTVSYWQSKNQGQTWERITTNIYPSSTPTLSIGGNGVWIDELRIHPVGALMKTCTTKQGDGITSQTDHNGTTIYYEYDDFYRLSAVYDKDRNLIESYEYNINR